MIIDLECGFYSREEFDFFFPVFSHSEFEPCIQKDGLD